MSDTIRSSIVWNTLELGASQLLTISVFVVLTYHLPLEVFGIFAIGALFIDFFYIQGQTAGIDVLLLEDKIKKSRLNVLFSNMFLAYLLIFGLLLIISFIVSLSFEEDKYRFVLPVMCLCILPIPFQIPAFYILNKKRDFQGTALRNILAAIAGGLVAL